MGEKGGPEILDMLKAPFRKGGNRDPGVGCTVVDDDEVTKPGGVNPPPIPLRVISSKVCFVELNVLPLGEVVVDNNPPPPLPLPPPPLPLPPRPTSEGELI